MNIAKSQQQFSVDDIPTEVSAGIARNTLSWHLSNLCRQGKLRRIGRGIYTAHFSNIFQVKANAKARSIYNTICPANSLLLTSVFMAEALLHPCCMT